MNAPPEMMLTSDDDSKIIEIFAKTLFVSDTYIDTICKVRESLPTISNQRHQTMEGPEIEKIIDGGDQANRIDVVFMGDGLVSSLSDTVQLKCKVICTQVHNRSA